MPILAKDISRKDCIKATGKPDATTGYIRKSISNKIYYAHRLAFAAQYGDIPEGYHIHHLCGNKICINTKHLVALSIKEHNKIHTHPRSMEEIAKRTECKYGHPLDGQNKKQRYCLECHRQVNSIWRQNNPKYFKTYWKTYERNK